MKDIFISHVEEDSRVALAGADLLERAGFTTWCYERDSLPGASYLLQTSQAIEESKAVLLLISVHALSSHQVTKEVVRAHESNKPIIPLLLGVSHAQFQKRQPEWREAVGAAASLSVSPERFKTCIPKVLEGLKSLGIAPRPSRRPSDIGTQPLAPAPTVPETQSAPLPKVLETRHDEQFDLSPGLTLGSFVMDFPELLETDLGWKVIRFRVDFQARRSTTKGLRKFEFHYSTAQEERGHEQSRCLSELKAGEWEEVSFVTVNDGVTRAWLNYTCLSDDEAHESVVVRNVRSKKWLSPA